MKPVNASILSDAAVRALSGHLAEVRPELARIIAAIQDALPAEEVPTVTDAADVDWGRVREAVDRLEELLEENDAGAIDVFGESAPLLLAAFGSATASVEASLNGWDFSAALQALRAAKAGRDELK